MIRKKGSIVIILFVFIFGIIAAYLYLNKNSQKVEFDLYQNIPSNSIAVIGFNYNGIHNSLTGNFILNYFEGMSSIKKNQQELFYNEIISCLLDSDNDSIDRSILCIYPKDSIYTIELMIRVNTINEELKIIRELLNKYHFSLLETESKNNWFSDSMNITVNYNNDLIRIQTALENVDVVDDNIKSTKKFNIDQIKESFSNHAQVCLWIKENAVVQNNHWIQKHPEIFMNIDFLMNKVNLSAEFKSNDINKIFKPVSEHVPLNDSSELQFWCSFNKDYFNTHTFLKESFIKKIDSLIGNIGLDISLFEDNYNGDLSFVKGKDVEIQESYLTYSYDDYFNKIEKINYKTSVVPQFTGLIGVDDELLFTSLKEKGLIKTKNKKQILVNIPIYEIQTLSYLNNIVFSSPSISDTDIHFQQDSIPFFFKSKVSAFNQMQLQMNSTDSSVVLEGEFKIDF